MLMRKKCLFILMLFVFLLLPCAFVSAKGGDYFYNQLTDTQKTYYDAIASSGLGNGDMAQVLITRSETKNDPDVDSAVAAFSEDHAEIFWAKTTWTNRVKAEDGMWEYYLRPTYVAGFDKRNIQTDIRYVDSVVAEIIAGASKKKTMYDKLLYVHNWLTRNNAYNTNTGAAVSEMPWSAFSALSPDYSPVCEGYSKAFKMICNEMGVPCVLVSDEDHMWNYASIRDRWYAVDVTYDDPVRKGSGKIRSGRENKKYFLVGAGTKMGSKTFISTHTPDNGWLDDQLHMPELQFDKYNKNNDVSSVSLNKKKATIKLSNKNLTVKLKATVKPSKALNKEIYWENSNPEVAEITSIDGMKCTVTGLSPGTTVITVTTAEGSYTKSCTITVKEGKKRR